MKLIEQYRRNRVVKGRGKPKMRLFEYITGVFDGSLETTDDDNSNDSNEMQYLLDNITAGSDELIEEAEEALEDGAIADNNDPGRAEGKKSKTKYNKNSSPGKGTGASKDSELDTSVDGSSKNGLKRQGSEDYKANTP